MESFLPIDVIYRQKTGFGAPLRKWLRGDMRSFLHDTLSEKNIRKRNIFDYNSTMNLIKMNHDGHIDASYVIFSILCIELWCQNFLD
jgi:asparagine synthase (glutamine-hydrolysing)